MRDTAGSRSKDIRKHHLYPKHVRTTSQLFGFCHVQRLTKATCSKLYRIQGDIIRNIFSHNAMSGQSLRSEELYSRIIVIDHALEQWKWELPPSSTLLPLELVQNMDSESWAYNKIQTTLTLRYLNVRALLFRKVLERSLNQITKASPSSPSIITPDGSLPIGPIMIQGCADACIQTITIIRTIAAQPRVLPAWWYTAYYGKSHPLLFSHVPNGSSVQLGFDSLWSHLSANLGPNQRRNQTCGGTGSLHPKGPRGPRDCRQRYTHCPQMFEIP